MRNGSAQPETRDRKVYKKMLHHQNLHNNNSEAIGCRILQVRDPGGAPGPLGDREQYLVPRGCSSDAAWREGIMQGGNTQEDKSKKL